MAESQLQNGLFTGSGQGMTKTQLQKGGTLGIFSSLWHIDILISFLWHSDKKIDNFDVALSIMSFVLF